MNDFQTNLLKVVKASWQMCMLVLLMMNFAGRIVAADPLPSIEELKRQSVLDDYYSNVIYGYNIITKTQEFANRYVGNQLNCTNCHLKAGAVQDALPLNVAGLYPLWRKKNGRSTSISLRIRECFVYHQNGIMPPENAPEIQAIATYISYLSYRQVIGEIPEGRGVPTLDAKGIDANPANGRIVYAKNCSACHGTKGKGTTSAPPVWGGDSYAAGSGMHSVVKAAGFIWANMPLGKEKSLSHQQALDVSSYINSQTRPADPGVGKLVKLLEALVTGLGFIINK